MKAFRVIDRNGISAVEIRHVSTNFDTNSVDEGLDEIMMWAEVDGDGYV